MALSEKLRAARKAAELTLDELALKAGVSKTYLWELERDESDNKKPSADVLLKIANALSTTIGHLLDVETVKTQSEEVELSPSLVEFRNRMKSLKTPLSDQDVRDLANMRFRGGQPRTADDWNQLFLVLKNSSGST